VEIENANNGSALNLTRLVGPATPAWATGTYAFMANRFLRDALPDGPYDDMDIGLRVEAESAIATALRPYVSPRDMTAENNSCAADSPGASDGTCTAARIAKNGKFRFGRLQLNNTYGSEKLPLSVPIQSRYWSGGHFVNNNQDNCTVINVPVAQTLAASAKPDGLPKLYFYPVVIGKNELLSTDAMPTVQTMAGVATVLLGGGQAKLQFAAPRKRGWLDLILEVPDYMSFNWGNCNGQTGTAGMLDDRPCARATFGIFGNKSSITYTRENY
jgi:MSHA biogenesis protein MshQ